MWFVDLEEEDLLRAPGHQDLVVNQVHRPQVILCHPTLFEVFRIVFLNYKGMALSVKEVHLP
jgi:hypothetical protein